MKKRVTLMLLALTWLILSVTVVSADGGKVHYVKPGESLSAIAYYYGVTPAALMAANGIHNPDFIYANQKLVIPGTGYSGYSGTTNCQQHYTVKWGDTLSGIAWAHGTTVQAISQASNLYGDVIHEGQKLCVSGSHASGYQAPATNQHDGDKYHVVRAGDTLSGIAYQYGVSQAALMQANYIADAGWINIGQKLVIPGGQQTYAPKKKAPAVPHYAKHESTVQDYRCFEPVDVWTHEDEVLVEEMTAWCGNLDIIPSPDQMTSVVVRVQGQVGAAVRIQRGNADPVIVYTGDAPGHDADFAWYPTAPGYHRVYVDGDKYSEVVAFDVAPGQRGWVDFKLTSVSENPRPRNNKGWSAKVTKNGGEAVPQNNVASVLIVRGPASGLPIRIDTDGEFTARCYTGQKPEHGPGACEFGGLWPGKYTLTLEGAGVSIEVFVDGQATAEVTFDPV